MSRILITGGLGFIGSNIARSFVADGAQVFVFDNCDSESGANPFNLSEIAADVEIIDGDIRNEDQIEKAVRGVDLIINCAASTSHSRAMRNPSANLDVNGRGVIYLLEALRRFNPTAKLIQIGTTTQTGPLSYSPADELHPEFPVDIYSANKMLAEKFVLMYHRSYGLRTTVLRLPNVYGPRAAIASPEFTFNNYFIGLALQGKPIPIYGVGSQLRNLLYVGDVVDAVLNASFSDNVIGEVFFAVGDTHMSVKAIAEATCDAIGGSIEERDWPEQRRRIDVGDAVFSNEKIKDALGWSPKVDLRNGLNLTEKFFRAHLSHYLY